ncbi:MAG: hypothetical protein ACK5L5_08135 [Bacteroidales bacterium]
MKNKCQYLLLCLVATFAACTNVWDEHYAEKEPIVNSEDIAVFDQDIVTYLGANKELSLYKELISAYGLIDTLENHNQSYTLFAYPNEVMSTTEISDTSYFVNTCLVGMELIPSKLYAGQVLQVATGKYIAVGVDEADNVLFYRSQLMKTIKLNDGVVYILDTAINSPRSLYEYFEALGDDYSLFKSMVKSYEEKVPDYDASTPIGIDNTGNTIYDTVFVVKNSLLDRYTSSSMSSFRWTMRMENASSTMLIPSNTVLQKALDDAYENIKTALRRKPHSKDSIKVREWLISALFYDQEYESATLAANNTEDIYSVDGYREGFTAAVDGKQWRPSVQLVDTSKPIEFSNGVGYFVTKLKVPNNVLVWRFKERFYVWENCTDEEKAKYFSYDGFENQRIKGGSTFGGWGEYAPTIYYNTFRNYVTDAAREASPSLEESYPCSVTFTCIGLDDEGNVQKVLVPPGEYMVSLGFGGTKNKFTVGVYYKGKLVGDNDKLNTSTNFDRYGVKKYSEYFYPADYYSASGGKASSYDTDGREVGVIMVEGEGLQEVQLTFKTLDDGYYGSYFEMYHWCLRPTENNY